MRAHCSAMDPHQSVRKLSASADGDELARSRLLEVLYDDLRRMAKGHLQRESPGHTLQPTALVHEAYVRLVGQEQVDYRSRRHFLAIASTTMRRALVDHARSRQREKRGGAAHRERVDPDSLISDWSDPIELLTIDSAINDLAAANPRHARVVEMRFFGGLTLDETAEVLEVSRDTVKNDWRFARAFLNARLMDSLDR